MIPAVVPTGNLLVFPLERCISSNGVPIISASISRCHAPPSPDQNSSIAFPCSDECAINTSSTTLSKKLFTDIAFQPLLLNISPNLTVIVVSKLLLVKVISLLRNPFKRSPSSIKYPEPRIRLTKMNAQYGSPTSALDIPSNDSSGIQSVPIAINIDRNTRNAFIQETATVYPIVVVLFALHRR